jgi:hypothetical protein
MVQKRHPYNANSLLALVPPIELPSPSIKIDLFYLHVGCNPPRVNGQDGEFISLEIFRKLLNIHVDSGLGYVIRSHGAGIGGKTNGAENGADGEDLSLILLLQQWQKALSDKYSADDIGVEYVEQCLRRSVGKNRISMARNECQLFELLTGNEPEHYETYVVKELFERSVPTPALLMRTYK